MSEIIFDSQSAKNKFCSMMSLCKRAGQLVSGESGSENAIKAKKAQVVFLSCDASKNTQKKFFNKSKYYNIPIFTLEFTKEQLGKMIGEAQRSVITITGGDFTKQLTLCNKRTDEKLD